MTRRNSKVFTQTMLENGFSVTTRNLNIGEDGKLRYLTLACARSGSRPSIVKNSLRPQPSQEVIVKQR